MCFCLFAYAVIFLICKLNCLLYEQYQTYRREIWLYIGRRYQYYNSLTAQVCKYINEITTECLLCRTTSFRHRFKSKVDSWTAEHINIKHHFITSNEGTLSCFIKSVLYYCIKSRYDVLRERDWLSECDCLHLIQHSFHLQTGLSEVIA